MESVTIKAQRGSRVEKSLSRAIMKAQGGSRAEKSLSRAIMKALTVDKSIGFVFSGLKIVR
jgi:hypothetical protein